MPEELVSSRLDAALAPGETVVFEMVLPTTMVLGSAVTTKVSEYANDSYGYQLNGDIVDESKNEK